MPTKLAPDAITLQDGVLSVKGTDLSDIVTASVVGERVVVSVTAKGPNGNVVDSRSGIFPLSAVEGIRMDGFDGNDLLSSITPVPCTLYGGNGNDVMYGGLGADLLVGGYGNDLLAGRGGNDTLRGGPDVDFLYGEGGSDSLEGGGGADWMYGGDGDDTLKGGGGQDYMSGGPGKNTLEQ